MGRGGCLIHMSDLFDELGLDENELEWYDLAACRGLPEKLTNIFFDDYETDSVISEQADQMCVSCPVAKQCLLEGLRTRSYGLWGGVFLDYTGKPAPKFNKHKTDETWKQLARIHGYRLTGSKRVS